MEVTPESRAIAAAKAFAVERGLRFEEPVVAICLEDGRYQVTMPVEGASNPNLVIDPPEFIVQLDLEKDQIILLPAM